MRQPEVRNVTVQTLKFDGAKHRRWKARLIEMVGALLILEGRFDRDVHHEHLGAIRKGTLSVEYYWLDRWYNVFRFFNNKRHLLCYYCNVSMPPTMVDDLLSYVDLDIDVLVRPDLSYTILDMEEFDHNSRTYKYPEEVQTNAKNALAELLSLIETKQFPFDYRADK